MFWDSYLVVHAPRGVFELVLRDPFGRPRSSAPRVATQEETERAWFFLRDDLEYPHWSNAEDKLMIQPHGCRSRRATSCGCSARSRHNSNPNQREPTPHQSAWRAESPTICTAGEGPGLSAKALPSPRGNSVRPTLPSRVETTRMRSDLEATSSQRAVR